MSGEVLAPTANLSTTPSVSLTSAEFTANAVTITAEVAIEAPQITNAFQQTIQAPELAAIEVAGEARLGDVRAELAFLMQHQDVELARADGKVPLLFADFDKSGGVVDIVNPLNLTDPQPEESVQDPSENGYSQDPEMPTQVDELGNEGEDTQQGDGEHRMNLTDSDNSQDQNVDKEDKDKKLDEENLEDNEEERPEKEDDTEDEDVDNKDEEQRQDEQPQPQFVSFSADTLTNAARTEEIVSAIQESAKDDLIIIRGDVAARRLREKASILQSSAALHIGVHDPTPELIAGAMEGKEWNDGNTALQAGVAAVIQYTAVMAGGATPVGEEKVRQVLGEPPVIPLRRSVRTEPQLV